MSPDDDFTKKWMSHDIGFYMWNMGELSDVLAERGISTMELERAHRDIVVRVMEDVSDAVTEKFGDVCPGVVQAALTSMVGMSLLATFDQQMDHIMFQIDVMEMEGGDMS